MSTTMRRVRKRAPRKAFSEMDLGRIGVVGLVLTLALLAGALNIGKILDLLGQSSYSADLTETGGLRTGDDVRVAGIKVGKVKGIELEADRVVVTFGLGNIHLGDQTRAYVKSDNALGSKFLAIDPAGNGEEDHIPLTHTDPGFAVNEELGDLTRTTAKIDARRLAEAMTSASAVLSRTPTEFKSALRGVSDLSRTISSRDDELHNLLERASSVSALLSARSTQVTAIISNGSQLFQELALRRQVIGNLLHNVQAATYQLVGLVHDNRNSFKPALTKLRQTAELLTHYRSTLDFAIKNLAIYGRSLGEAIASGPFFQAYLANVASPEDLVTGIIKDQVSGTR